jgi:hypothetical protein
MSQRTQTGTSPAEERGSLQESAITSIETKVEQISILEEEDEEEVELAKSVEWLHSVDLQYVVPAPPPPPLKPLCHNKLCLNSRSITSVEPSNRGENSKGDGTAVNTAMSGGGLSRVADDVGGSCARCKGPWYCTRSCQRQDWKRCHKALCRRTARLVAGYEPPPDGKGLLGYLTPNCYNERAAVARLLRKLRLYMGPFAIANEQSLTRHSLPGFILLQTPNVLSQFTLLEASVDPLTGHAFDRKVLLNYMTYSEFEAMIHEKKDETQLLSPVACALKEALHKQQEYEKQKEGDGSGNVVEEAFVVLCKFRDGKIKLIRMPYVPQKSVCRALSGDYVGKDCIQLNLEDN